MALLDNKRSRWHRRQNKFGKVWQQTKVTTRLVVSYFNWIWQHSRFKTTAAQRAGLTLQPWAWHDIITYPLRLMHYLISETDRIGIMALVRSECSESVCAENAPKLNYCRVLNRCGGFRKSGDRLQCTGSIRCKSLGARSWNDSRGEVGLVLLRGVLRVESCLNP
jgi:hypothetical protein